MAVHSGGVAASADRQASQTSECIMEIPPVGEWPIDPTETKAM